MALLLLVGTALAVFLGSAAVVEKDRFALVFAAGGLRIAGVLGLVMFTVFFIRRSFEARDIELLLSRPLSRVKLLLSYAAALSVLGLLAGLAQGLCVFALSFQHFGNGQILWIASMIAENIILVNVALFFSMILTSAAGAAMAVSGFYILARLMGQILGTIDAGSRVYDLKILELVMQAISTLMPRLDLMGQTSWLIYGAGEGIGLGFIIAQGAVFTFLILMAALIDFVLRQF